MKYFIICTFLLFSTAAYAETSYGFVGLVEQQIPVWIDISTKLALNIFSVLWCFETFYQVTFKNVLGNNIKQLPVYIVTRVLFGSFFSYVMLKPEIYLGIIQLIGSKSSGFTFSGNTIQGFTAGWVYDQFINWTEVVYAPAQDAVAGISNIGKAVSYAFEYVIYLLCTICVVVQIIILKLEIYLTVFGALVLTGFAGSSWTFGIWNKYLDAVIGLGVRVLVFGLLFGLFKVLIEINPQSAGSIGILNATASIVITTACLYVIPAKLAGMVSGTASGHGLGTMAAAGLGGFVGASNAVGKVGGKAINSGKSAYDKIKDKVSGGGDKSSSKNNGIDTKLSGDYVNRTPPVKPMPPEFLDRNKGK